MLKKSVLLSLCALLALGFQSCSKSDDEPDYPGKPGDPEIRFIGRLTHCGRQYNDNNRFTYDAAGKIISATPYEFGVQHRYTYTYAYDRIERRDNREYGTFTTYYLNAAGLVTRAEIYKNSELDDMAHFSYSGNRLASFQLGQDKNYPRLSYVFNWQLGNLAGIRGFGSTFDLTYRATPCHDWLTVWLYLQRECSLGNLAYIDQALLSQGYFGTRPLNLLDEITMRPESGYDDFRRIKLAYDFLYKEYPTAVACASTLGDYDSNFAPEHKIFFNWE